MIKIGEMMMILDLHRQGLSVSAIARESGIDRKTVRKYIARGLEAPAYGPRKPRQAVIDPFTAYLRERVMRYPGLTGSRLFRELKDLGYGGGYTAVTDFLRDVRPAAAERERRISREGMVSVGGNFYSVPDATRRRVVEVHTLAEELHIFEDGALIATHPILEGRHQRHVEPGHRNIHVYKRRQRLRNDEVILHDSGDRVAQRPLAFYDAVRVMAKEQRP
ncbi:transposase [Mesorhizobium sp. M1A.F.Ca.IN.020.03.2.1]|uniref:Mu transposase domain-containing protein n=1 Tax=unclassified Mesorhizobium TaxID=325217 RepID=UPI000FCB2ED3|nr:MULTISPECIES: helix-turn-helix domain-containing protein [unclassified Mesorhizobium]RUV02472.1 transposase [Mesorhizobium sp. M1A.F.Ca.IN.020.03.2.1]RUV20547.1 transposase [Mesorhizobium sp. M1A.F.Ca.IN.022.04.1.1]RWB25729.1 MAG: transposase [Mesorhizobium sp.]RWD09645.1 MAG: transposase [Mesorhizobium sp.]RWE64280.1 MAG: transposase [Mesorhizobium sp.]